jgi:hypothetical protein
MSIRSLASKMDISHVFLSLIERGKKPVPDRLIQSLSAHLHDIDEDELRHVVHDAKKVKLAFIPTGPQEAEIAKAFARKVLEGFSDDELDRLRRILYDDGT